MGRTFSKTTLAALVLSSLVLGCHKSAVQTKNPEDPLLVSKKPVAGSPFTLNADSSPYTPHGTPPPPMPVTPGFNTSLPHEPLGPDVGGR